jgi:uncharacterized membrane protein
MMMIMMMMMMMVMMMMMMMMIARHSLHNRLHATEERCNAVQIDKEAILATNVTVSPSSLHPSLPTMLFFAEKH